MKLKNKNISLEKLSLDYCTYQCFPTKCVDTLVILKRDIIKLLYVRRSDMIINYKQTLLLLTIYLCRPMITLFAYLCTMHKFIDLIFIMNRTCIKCYIGSFRV